MGTQGRGRGSGTAGQVSVHSTEDTREDMFYGVCPAQNDSLNCIPPSPQSRVTPGSFLDHLLGPALTVVQMLYLDRSPYLDTVD